MNRLELMESIKNKRPTLSDSSISTYTSILQNLDKKIFKDEPYNPENINNAERVLEYLKDVPPNRRKTILSSLYIYTGNEKYKQKMYNDIKSYNDEIKEQTKTKTQKENWVDAEKIKDTLKEYEKNTKLLYKKTMLTMNDLQKIQNYIILALLSGIYIPPRRNLDYVNFKIKNIQPSDNYLKGNKIHFNSYKTAKTYGQQIIMIPLQLKAILKKWIKINPTEHLLFDKNNNKLTSVKLNQRINQIFNGKIGVNALRHTFLTDKYKTASEANKLLKNDLTNMGSSMSQANTYIKLN